jgi:hypothetical protein
VTVHELRPSSETAEWLTKQQAAARAQVSVRTIDRARQGGELRSSGGGGYAVRFRPEWVDDWLERRLGGLG